MVPLDPSTISTPGGPPDAGVPRAKRIRLAEEAKDRSCESSSLEASDNTDEQYAYVARDLALAVMSGRDPLVFGSHPGMNRDRLHKLALDVIPEILEWNRVVQHCSLTADRNALRILYVDQTVREFFFSFFFFFYVLYFRMI